MKQIRKRLTYANVVSSLALFLVLTGATALAATQLAKNSVGTKQLKNNAVTSAKIKKEAVTGAKIKNGTINGSKIDVGSLGTVPSATKATTATKADNAANADALGGQSASAYQPRTQWAVVKSDGTILSQSGGITMVSHNVNGGNYLDFGQSIVGKSIITSARYLDPNAGSNGAVVTAQPCSGALTTFPCLVSGTTGNPDVAFVLTADSEGTGGPFGFSILITP